MSNKKKRSELEYTQMNNRCKSIAKEFRYYFKQIKPKCYDNIFNYAERSINVIERVSGKFYDCNLIGLLEEYKRTGIINKQNVGNAGVTDRINCLIFLHDLANTSREQREGYINSLSRNSKLSLRNIINILRNDNYKVTEQLLFGVIDKGIFEEIKQVESHFLEHVEHKNRIALHEWYKEGCITIKKKYVENSPALKKVKLNKKEIELITNFLEFYIYENFKFNIIEEYYRELARTEIIEIMENKYDEFKILTSSFVEVIFKDVVLDTEEVPKVQINRKSKEFKHRTWKELERMIQDAGYSYTRSSGDHGVYINERGNVMLLPRGRTIGKTLQKHILRQLETQPRETEDVAITSLCAF